MTRPDTVRRAKEDAMNRTLLAILSAACLVLAMLAPAAQATVHLINVSNFVFTPRHVTITVGDTLRWVWVSGMHTATSGDTTACTPDGVYFDGPVDSSHPSFQYRPSLLGDIPYICRFHCGIGMKGLITVTTNGGAVPEGQPRGATLLRVAPNPFLLRASIELQLVRAEPVRVEIHDVTGRTVAVLADRLFDAGTTALTWDGRTAAGADARGGIYYATAVSGGARETAQLILVR